MNEQYLWDKTGEPDPEIQELEEILGVFGYQPKGLELPEDIKQTRRRRYFPLLAIAATLVMALLAGVVWLGLRHNQRQIARSEAPPVPVAPAPTSTEIKKPSEDVKSVNPTQHQESVATNRHRRTVSKTAAAPSQEAVLAKEQLMTALRLASEKLNLAQRKTQSPSLNQLRNQHKVG